MCLGSMQGPVVTVAGSSRTCERLILINSTQLAERHEDRYTQLREEQFSLWTDAHILAVVCDRHVGADEREDEVMMK